MARRRFDSAISRRMESGRRPTGESQWRFFRTRQARIRRSRAHRSVWCAALLCGALGVVFLSAGVAGAQTATWSISPSPDEGSRSILNDGSCASSTSCVAVGEFITSTNSPDRNLVESWNGTSWSIVPSPNQGSGFDQTSILVPSTGATRRGSTYLDAGAANATSVKFLLFGGIYGYAAPVVCTATATYYGWLCSWNTTTVPNGSYGLVSEASVPGGTAFSSGVGITVSNVPLATQLFLPQNGSDISGNVVFDASAQGADITGVYFVVTFGPLNQQEFLMATPTYYGWIGVWNSAACPPGYRTGAMTSKASSPRAEEPRR